MNEKLGKYGESPYVPSNRLSFAVKRGLINGNAPYTDEEKALARETIGATADEIKVTLGDVEYTVQEVISSHQDSVDGIAEDVEYLYGLDAELRDRISDLENGAGGGSSSGIYGTKITFAELLANKEQYAERFIRIGRGDTSNGTLNTVLELMGDCILRTSPNKAVPNWSRRIVVPSFVFNEDMSVRPLITTYIVGLFYSGGTDCIINVETRDSATGAPSYNRIELNDDNCSLYVI